MDVKKFSPIHNIKSLIIAFGLVLLCFLWVGLYYKIQGERQLERENVVRDIQNYSRAIAEHSVRTLRGLDEITLYLKYRAEESGLQIDLPRLVREGRFEGQPFVSLGVMDEQGKLVAGTQVPLPEINNRDLETFYVHRRTDGEKLFIGKPVVGRASGKLGIQLTRRINRTDGAFGGVVAVGVDPYYFAEFYKQVDLGENSIIALLGSDGVTRVRKTGNKVDMGFDYSEILKEIKFRDAEILFYQSPTDGSRWISSTRSLQEYPLAVLVGVDEKDAFKDLNRRIVVYYWVYGVMSVIIVLFVLVLLVGSARRQKAEDTLRESEARIRAISDSTQDAIVVMEPGGRIYYWNPAATRILGYTEEEALGRDLHALLTPQRYQAAARKGLLAFQQSGAGPVLGKTTEVSACHKDGHEVSVELSLSAISLQDGWHAVGIIRDITARKKAEKAVTVAKAHYQALVDQSFEALALVDIRTQEVLEVNRRFTEMFGYSLPEDAPLYVSRFVVDSQGNLDRVYNSLLLQQNVVQPEIRLFRRKNGVEVPVERAGTVITSLEGRNLYLASMRDMTEERRRQTVMDRDVAFARRVQQELLPKLSDTPFVRIRTIYHPFNFISGDFFHLEWQNEGTVLRGFLIDVSGHGLATAIQTSAINVLIREAASTKLSLLAQLQLINVHAEKYFADGAYAAILGFELDLSLRVLRYVGAGITQFFANGRKILTPGMFVGMWDDAEFIEGMLPIEAGDTFYFLTDGLTDALVQPENEGCLSPDGKQFDDDVAALECLSMSSRLRDDATGICLQVKQ